MLVLRGHTSKVNSLAVADSGAFVLSAGMNRQICVWDRTKDMVFVSKERERALEQELDQVDGARGETKPSMRVCQERTTTTTTKKKRNWRGVDYG